MFPHFVCIVHAWQSVWEPGLYPVTDHTEFNDEILPKGFYENDQMDEVGVMPGVIAIELSSAELPCFMGEQQVQLE